MKVLYIAYSCSPDHGSEDRIGWKIPLNSQEYNDVYVITKQEHKEKIEAYLGLHSEVRVRFWYVDIPEIYKKVFRGPAYSGRLEIWQKRALALARQICKEHQIDLIHQITPVEFRNIGGYGEIPGVKFVCGPVGGGEYVPRALRGYIGKQIITEGIRFFLNWRSLRKFEKHNILAGCDSLLFANEETKQMLAPLIKDRGTDDACFTEIGIDQSEIVDHAWCDHQNGKCIFLVAGRTSYRKGHRLLLDALSGLPEELDYLCRIVGNGPELCQLQKLTAQYRLQNKVEFCGRVSFGEMEKIYRQVDVLIMPSIRETTGSVLLEAMGRGLPVLTIGRFGGKVVVRPEAGWLYDGDSKAAILDSMRNMIVTCVKDKNMVRDKGRFARNVACDHTWEKKMMHYQTIYEKVVQDGGEHDG